ncbi:hypothetical protein [Nocardia miyunensis]|uniref:hypothetical protein n=1 Tax=Nocardia miyunensis TaxID=282684 RepID=UPI00083010A7|nr:hypothetical protein [Nocardia miyunensis]
MSTYTARVIRDEDAWMIEVPEIDRVTQALNLRQVEEMARDLIAIMTGTEPDSFDLVIEWPAHIAASLDAYRAAGVDAEQAAARATRARLDAAAALQSEGATVRDIGALMGVSFQRAQQILESGRTGAGVAAKSRKVKKSAATEKSRRRQAG